MNRWKACVIEFEPGEGLNINIQAFVSELAQVDRIIVQLEVERDKMEKDFYSQRSMGYRLKAYIKNRGLKTRYVQEQAGISKAYMWQLLNDKNPTPSAHVLDKIAQVLDITIDEILHP